MVLVYNSSLDVFLQESLRRVLQEKLDAVTKLSDLEVLLLLFVCV